MPTPVRPQSLLSVRYIAVTTLVFLAVVVVANRMVRYVDNHVVGIDRPPFWPIGQVELVRPDDRALLMAAGCIIIIAAALKVLPRFNFHPAAVGLAGLALTIATNSIHGIDVGWAQPISGGKGASAIQYYHDSLKIKGTKAFMMEYTANQTALLAHARTHPPGAVGFIHVLRLFLERPAYLAAAIAVIAISVMTLFGYGLLRELGFDPSTAGYATFLLLLVPAVQVYSLASIDAVIAALILGCIYFVIRKDPVESLVGTGLCMAHASFLTFAAFFLLAPMALLEWHVRRKITRTLGAIALVVAAYVAMYLKTGFSYFVCFRMAAEMENPLGFRLLAEPVSYFFTRIECVCEILLFFGPFLIVLAIRGIPQMSPSAKALFRSAILTLLAMFAAGAFHTGETARACLFIYPFLILPVAAGLRQASVKDKSTLAAVVFAQALFMQLLGDYFW